MSEIIKNKKKVAVVLFNLGGPDSIKAVKPFLFNLFNDKYIITLPSFFRYLIALLISSRRRKTAEEIYEHTGGKSPILEETIAQKEALRLALNSPKSKSEFEIFIAMRHWHPMMEEVIKKIEEYSPDEIILLPLYPQFSTTTTASSVENFKDFFEKSSLKNTAKLKLIGCYPYDEGFIEAHADLIIAKVGEIKDQNNYRILFSAHGLPEKIVKSGDPYQWQVEQSVKNIVKKLAIKDLDYKITYQSRVGPLKWISPNTEDEIRSAAEVGKNLIIVPVAFVSEHVETKVELDIEYKKITDNYNIQYLRVPTLSTSSKFIEYLSKLVVDFSKKEGNIESSSNFSRICPEGFSKCLCSR